jgi:uncharacterized protein with von Willebrand factor type A (vWA) domain
VLLRYSRWDGSQVDVFSVDDVLEHLADEVLGGRDLEAVLRRLMQHGSEFSSGRRAMGLRELLERIRGAREQRRQQYNLGSSLDEIRRQLEEVVETERRGIQRRLGRGNAKNQAPAPGSTDPAFRQLLEKLARERLDQLDRMPPDLGGRLQALHDYDFLDPDAREQFQQLVKRLQEQLLESTFKGMMQSIQSLTPEAMRQIREMTHDLNRLLQQRLRGEQPDISSFMAKWGQFFPSDIQNVDQLAEHLRQQMAQMQSLLNAMSPEHRRELAGLLESLLTDQGLQHELRQLAQAMDRIFPELGGAGQDDDFFGEEPVSLQDALKLMGEMEEIGQLEQSLRDAVRTNDASDVDSDAVGRLLGHQAREMTRQLQQLTRMLEEAGLIQRGAHNRWELTPLAARKIGDKALREIFAHLRESGMLGKHALQRRGDGVERLEQTKPYAFGDPLSLDVRRTVMNAVRREGRGIPVRIRPDDLEVHQNEQLTTCSTLIMLDMSMSMMGRRFEAGRRVALALESLIRAQYPRDTLQVAAFSYFVLPLEPRMLLEPSWVENGGGTNFQEALRQARLMLGSQKRGTRQIILITDGEPTTYYRRWSWGDDEDGDGLSETLREVSRCTRERITINVFMMDRHQAPGDSAFVRAMVRLNKGRAFFASADKLGEYVLLDYLQDKRRRFIS